MRLFSSIYNVIKNKAGNFYFYLQMKRLPRVLISTVKGLKIKLHVESRIELKRALKYEIKEPNTLQWIEDLIKDNEVFYDIGANIGQYSLFAAIRRDKKLKVFSFEPESLNFAKLNKNIHLNSLSPCITPYSLAFSDIVALDRFNIQKFKIGNALHSLGKHIDHMQKEFEPAHVQGVLSITLDYLVFDLGLDFPNHIKIDVDGIEKKIVGGGEKVFSDSRMKSVLVEVSRNSTYEEDRKWFTEFFISKGFVLANYPDLRKDTENLIFKR